MSIAFFVMALAASDGWVVPTRAAQQACRPKAVMADADHVARVQPLASMPPAKQVRGIYREIDGCPVLSVVRERVGQSLDQEPLRPRSGYSGRQSE